MTPDKIEEVYDELAKLVIKLDPNPAARGPAYLQDLISTTRGYLNQVSFYLQEVHRERHRVESKKEAHEAAFQVAADELLASDARVTRLPNIDDRKAMINLLLREERRTILDLNRQIKDLGHVEKAVRHRHKELESTMSAIRMQRSLVDMELRTGSFYGDENDASRGNTWGRRPPTGITSDDIDESELERLVSEATAATADETGVAEPEVAPVEPLPSAVAKPVPVVEPEEAAQTCSVCGEPQFETPGGPCCAQGHGGAPANESSVSSSDEDDDFGLGDLMDGAEYAPKKARAPKKPKPAPQVIAPVAPQPVVAQPASKPNTHAEDADIDRFLDGDDFSDVFKSLE